LKPATDVDDSASLGAFFQFWQQQFREQEMAFILALSPAINFIKI
jgi:hypothetical protein